MKEIRKLRADEIECKISQINEKGCSLLLYKTARTDMAILDETFGCFGWMCDYDEIKGNLFCSIRIHNPDTGEWVTKVDCGVESAFGDKEKGEASDAFKRAGFKVGIGRELYSAPFIWIQAKDIQLKKFVDKKTGRDRFMTYDRFSVKEISYTDKGDIASLVIRNDSLNRNVYTFGIGRDEMAEEMPKVVTGSDDRKKFNIEEVRNILSIIDDIESLHAWYLDFIKDNPWLTILDKKKLTELCAERKKIIEG